MAEALRRSRTPGAVPVSGATPGTLRVPVAVLAPAEALAHYEQALQLWPAVPEAARPPDAGHHYGHGKAEYFSAGLEGLMIFVAAAVIGVGVFYIKPANYVPFIPENTGTFGEYGWSGVMRARIPPPVNR